MGKDINAIISKKYDYQNNNYYHLPELNSYEIDVFN